MQKKIIALAVAGVLAAPLAAQAAATAEVYGKARISVGVISDDNAGATAEDSKISVTSHASRLGFKGSNDLNNGMQAIYGFEAAIDLDDANNDGMYSNRNTYVGLAGDFGKVIVGRYDTPYKKATSDIFGDTHADYNAVISSTHDTRFDNSIGFYSKDMSGFKFALAVSSDTANDDLPDGDNTDEMDGTSLSLSYSAGDISASLAVQSIAQGTGKPDQDATKFGLGYTLNNATKFSFIFENTEGGTVATPTDQDAIYFSVSHMMGDITLMGAIGQLDESSSNAKDGGDYLALGVSKSMSDSTELYVQYAQMANDTAGTNGLVDVTSGFADKTTSAFSVGMNMEFSSM